MERSLMGVDLVVQTRIKPQGKLLFVQINRLQSIDQINLLNKNKKKEMRWSKSSIFIFFFAVSAVSLVRSSNSSSSSSNNAYPSLDQQLHANYISTSGGGSSSSNNGRSGFQGRLWDFPNPAPGANLFNTSLAFTIPLFSINTQALTGSARSLLDSAPSAFASYANDAASAYSSAVGLPPLGSGVVTALAIPALIAGILILLFDIFSRPFLSGLTAPLMGNQARASDSIFSNGFSGMAEYLLTFVENSLDHVPTIDGEECIKRSVCEAHSNPKKYGLIALPLQLLFPPYPYSGTDDTSKISKYQLAARYGKNENANCGAQYHGCVVNPLDLVHSFARMITDF
ncbi:hypothetical protein CHUAL_012065 [Chamberlinius hualienensis]